MSFSGVWFPKVYQGRSLAHRHVKALFQLPTPATKHGHTNVCIQGVKKPFNNSEGSCPYQTEQRASYWHISGNILYLVSWLAPILVFHVNIFSLKTVVCIPMKFDMDLDDSVKNLFEKKNWSLFFALWTYLCI